MGIVNRVVSPSLLEISLKQSRRLLYKINAKNSSHCKLGLMMYACWNTLENSATVYLNDSATNVCGLFFFCTSFVAKSFKGTEACTDADKQQINRYL